MTKTKKFILVSLSIVVLFIIILFIVSGGKLGSWSEADLFKALKWMLCIIILNISRILWKFADTHISRNEVFLRNWFGFKVTYKNSWIPQFKKIKQDYTLKDAFEITGWLFASIVVFGLSTSVFLHYVATILAALAIFITVVRSVPKGSERTYYIICFSLGILGWVVGFLTDYWSVYLGEVAYFITPAYWIVGESNKVTG